MDFKKRLCKLAQTINSGSNVIPNGSVCPRADYNGAIVNIPPTGHVTPCMGDVTKDKCEFFGGLSIQYDGKSGDIDKDRKIAGVFCKYK